MRGDLTTANVLSVEISSHFDLNIENLKTMGFLCRTITKVKKLQVKILRNNGSFDHFGYVIFAVHDIVKLKKY